MSKSVHRPPHVRIGAPVRSTAMRSAQRLYFTRHYSCSTMIGSLQLHPRNAVCGCRLDESLYPDSNPD